MSERSKRLNQALGAHGYTVAAMTNPREMPDTPGAIIVDLVPADSAHVEKLIDKISVEKLPDDGRYSVTRKFRVNHTVPGIGRGVVKFYVTAGMYPDHRLGEIFIRGDKMGEVMTGALDVVATMVSIGLQHGVPFSIIIEKLRGTRGFGPDGFTGDPEFPKCSSLFDLLAQWLTKTFPDGKYVNPRLAGRIDPDKEAESK